MKACPEWQPTLFCGARPVIASRAQTIFPSGTPGLVELRDSASPPKTSGTGCGDPRADSTSTRALLFNIPEISVILLTVPDGAATMENRVAERPWIRMVTMLRSAHLGEAFRRLRELNLRYLSCIGGAHAGDRASRPASGDDIYSHDVPAPGRRTGTPMYPRRFEGSVVVRKRGTAEESGVLFEHFHLSATECHHQER